MIPKTWINLLLIVLLMGSSLVGQSSPFDQVLADLKREASDPSLLERSTATLKVVAPSAIDSKRIEGVIQEITRVMGAFCSHYHIAPPAIPQEARVLLLDSKRSYEAFCRATGATVGAESHFEARRGILVLNVESNERSTRHEAIHLLSALLEKDSPKEDAPLSIWLEEGLAEYWAGLLKGQTVPEDHPMEHLRLLFDTPVPSLTLEELMALTAKSEQHHLERGQQRAVDQARMLSWYFIRHLEKGDRLGVADPNSRPPDSKPGQTLTARFRTFVKEHMARPGRVGNEAFAKRMRLDPSGLEELEASFRRAFERDWKATPPASPSK
jgi:hypothetical protein